MLERTECGDMGQVESLFGQLSREQFSLSSADSQEDPLKLLFLVPMWAKIQGLPEGENPA